jgi:hypothetical protein
MKYKSISKSKVLTANDSIKPDGYGSIVITNTGADAITINDNIALVAGASWNWTNHPNVVIDEQTSIRFAGVNMNKKVLVQMFYYKEV